MKKDVRRIQAVGFAILLGAAFLFYIKTPEAYAQKKQQPQGCVDFATGGGIFQNTQAPGEVNFGFNIGFKNGDETPGGELNLIDHESSIHVKINSAVSYVPATFFSDPCRCRRFEGTGTMDGSTVNYVIEVCDFAEPGAGADEFGVLLCDPSLSPCDIGEPAQVYLAIGTLAGGNIQLHTACPQEGCP